MNEKIDDMAPDGDMEKVNAAIEKHLHSMMNPGEAREFRQKIPAEFLKDAADGLKQINDDKQLNSVLQQLNRRMRKELKVKKFRQSSRSTANLTPTYWMVIFVILFATIAFFMIMLRLKH
jgi:hypothetical protein